TDQDLEPLAFTIVLRALPAAGDGETAPGRPSGGLLSSKVRQLGRPRTCRRNPLLLRRCVTVRSILHLILRATHQVGRSQPDSVAGLLDRSALPRRDAPLTVKDRVSAG